MAIGCLALSGTVHRAGAQPRSSSPPSPPPTPEQARAFLCVDLAHQLLQSPLAFKAENASLETIAAQVQKALAESDPTAKIEVQVRKANPIRLSFAVKNSTVGKVLRSSAALAGAQLWMFSDHFLLAPEESLLPEEKEALAQGTMAKAPGGARERDGLIRDHQQSFATFISGEISQLQKGQGKAAPSDKVTFAQLSPEAQEMLQTLLAHTKDSFLQSPIRSAVMTSALTSFTLDRTTVVGFSPSVHMGVPNTTSQIQVTFDKGSANWALNGRSRGISTGGHDKPASRPTLPFADPSAGNS